MILVRTKHVLKQFRWYLNISVTSSCLFSWPNNGFQIQWELSLTNNEYTSCTKNNQQPTNKPIHAHRQSYSYINYFSLSLSLPLTHKHEETGCRRTPYKIKFTQCQTLTYKHTSSLSVSHSFQDEIRCRWIALNTRYTSTHPLFLAYVLKLELKEWEVWKHEQRHEGGQEEGGHIPYITSSVSTTCHFWI